MIIQLKTPIKEGETTISEVTINEIKASDYAALGNYMVMDVKANCFRESGEVIVKYITRLTGLTPKQLDKLSFADFGRLRAEIVKKLNFVED